MTVTVGAEVLTGDGFRRFAGKRVGLITNHTGLALSIHVADLLAQAKSVRLTAIFAPEHGFRGTAEAGAKVRDGRDPKTGVKVFSLYGATRKPTPAMLQGLDVLVFDIQDIGARFYTYISTMGLAMEAAAAARIPFVVLDRPNPLGGEYMSGFVLESALKSFVGQYPIPIVHGMTVGELARMIQGERWMAGLDRLLLEVIRVAGWRRDMRWDRIGRTWIATSPNIPTFESALVYPGIGIIGESGLVNEGRGTPIPFSQFGAPWLDAKRVAKRMNAYRNVGVSFEATRYTPRAFPDVASDPKFEGENINGVRLVLTDTARYAPLEVGIQAMTHVIEEARRAGITRLFRNLKMFYAISGTRRLHRMLMDGAEASAIIASWQREVGAFRDLRQRYLLY